MKNIVILEPTKLEVEIIKWLKINRPKLKEQLNNSNIIEREYSGCGFFFDFSVSQDVNKIKSDVNPIYGPRIKSSLLPNGAGSIIFLENGYITTLEVFGYDNIFPEKINDFELLENNKLTKNTLTIDTHTHVNFNAFKKDGDEIIKKSLKEDVWMINVGSEGKTSQRAIDYAQKYKEGVYAAVGLHPIHLFPIQGLGDENNVEKFDYQRYLELVQQNKVVAIGEVGLDYHHFEEDHDIDALKKLQQEVFKEFLKLSYETKKPLIIHCWDAYDDLLEILNNFFNKNKIDYKIGVIHSFIGSWKTAQKFLNLGFKIGLNGIITYSESYDKLIQNCDLKNILIETDAPYLTPKPLPRHDRNEPVNVKLVAKKIATVKNVKSEEVLQQTTKNARKIFNI